MTKLEECAKAVCSANNNGSWDFDATGVDASHPDYCPEWKMYIEDVRAVLMALRDPDSVMVEAGMKCADVSLAAEFTAMIDAVLDSKA